MSATELLVGHAPPPADDGLAPSLTEAETILSEWFDADVILTSSGRAALRLALADLGLNRYVDRIAMSAKTSACVFDAVIRHGFPVDPAYGEPASATVLIHQYGFRQHWSPDTPVVEDICHAFFASPESGARRWAGQHAVFSLPKFFSMAGMTGGLVVRDKAVAARLRDRIASEGLSADPARDRDIFRSSDQDQVELEAMYLRRLLKPAPDPAALAGLPDHRGLREAGARRAEIIATLLGSSGARQLPAGWAEALPRNLPFVFPLFGPEDRLSAVEASLREQGIASGIYSIDRAGDNRSPDWGRAVLLPCHQYLDDAQVQAIVGALG